MSSDLCIKDYSERAIALFGIDTKFYTKLLSSIGGKFNPNLKYKDDEKKAGWIFPKTKKDIVDNILTDMLSGKAVKDVDFTTSASISSSDLENPKRNTKSMVSVENSVSNMSGEYVLKKDFLNLVSKYERLEQKLERLEQLITNPKVKNNKKDLDMRSLMIEVADYVDEDSEFEEEEEKTYTKSFLRSKK